jgi:putative DNA primase/helicase
VFPLEPSGKRPLSVPGYGRVPWGRLEPMSTADIVDCWTRFPDANVGLDCEKSGYLVVDVDDEGAWKRLLADVGVEEPQTLTVRTAKGRHLYFQNPGGLGNRPLAVGVDVRGEGGYVVTVGSRVSGHLYAFDDVEVAIAQAPEWMKQRLAQPPSRTIACDERARPLALDQGVLARCIARVREAEIGTRNETLNRSAYTLGGLLGRDGVDAHGVPAQLLRAALDAGLPEDEALATISSGLQAGLARPLGVGLTDTEGTLDVEDSAWASAPDGDAEHLSAPSEVASIHETDIGNARRLAARHGRDLHYVPAANCWRVWDDSRWRIDDTLEVYERAKETALTIYNEAALEPDNDRRQRLAKWAVASESTSRIEAMVRLARSEPDIPVTLDKFDSDPWVLNVANGTLDLRTLCLRPHRREDLITKIVPIAFDVDATAPTFEKYLRRISGDNFDLIAFLRRAAGYSLTGDTSERVVFILWGVGMNGKTVWIKVMRRTLGDYGMRTPTETLMRSTMGGENRGLARLKGARCVSASESEDGDRFATALIKDLSGDEPIAARALYQEQFEYQPQFKLWLATNHRPSVSADDQAIWDRLRLIPFTERIGEEECDPHLIDKLQDELPGILAWAVRGCREWQEIGLGVPDEVRSATDDYRAEMDSLGDFIEERCVLDLNARVEAGALHKAYRDFTYGRGGRPLGFKKFNSAVDARQGISKVKASVMCFHGIGLAGEREHEGDNSTSSP